MNKIKHIFLFGFISLFALVSCDDDGDDESNNGGTNNATDIITKSGEITADETWTSDNIYRLDGRVTVTGGATLTIEPGTVIKANPGTGSFASALLISREGKINAAGTADAPIIFTAISDDLEPGEIASPNLDPANNGLWGGVIILGKAPISASGDVVELQIEGIPTSDANGLYGGTQDDHNSGVFKYVSIRHGGSNIGQGNEINGLTMGGVGTATEINHVEVVANQDDGLEWFGGSVSVDHILVWNNGDDALDCDQDWTGTADNFIVVNPGDRAMELDGPEGNQNRSPNYTITNGTVYMANGQELINVDDNTDVNVSNTYFYGLNSSQVCDGFAGNSIANISNLEVTLPAGRSIADVFVDIDPNEVSEVGENQNTVGVTAATDYNWTWAATSNALNGIGL